MSNVIEFSKVKSLQKRYCGECGEDLFWLFGGEKNESVLQCAECGTFVEPQEPEDGE